MKFRQLIAICILFSLPFCVSAELLKGKIWYSSGAPASNIRILIKGCIAGANHTEFKTKSNGNYRITVTSGVCDLSIPDKKTLPVSISISEGTTIADFELIKSGNVWELNPK